MNYYMRQEHSFRYLDVVRRLFQLVLFGFMAAPVAYLGVWQIVAHLWPPECQSPDGSTLLCLGNPQSEMARDLTAWALSLGLAIALAACVYAWSVRWEQRKSTLGHRRSTISR
jgi:hypothetical protein